MAGPGDLPTDDEASAELQIEEIKKMAARHHDWMEVAYSSADLRRIVIAGKLAIVMGIEIDNIGNFNKPCDLPCHPSKPKSQRRLTAYFKAVYGMFSRST